jgi:hypothetical protein
VSSERPDDGHPVLTGLAALVGVAVVVGLLISGAALAASSVLGLGDEKSSAGATASASMYLPRPSDTVPATGPAMTLAPGDPTPTETPTAPPTPEFPITLNAAEASVSPMQEINLTGTYPTGEDKVVQVQRFEDDEWVDFSTVDAVVSNGAFSTYVLTARSGENRFRVRDTDSDVVSNEVTVQVG